MKLGLGTAQFGLNYGISNRAGKTPESEGARMLELAASGGIDVLDTAPAYGDAEAVLGRLLPPNHQFRIVTKTPRLNDPTDPIAGDFEECLLRSLMRMRLSSLHALLVHHIDDLLGPRGDEAWATLTKLKERKLVAKIGVSVYTGTQIDRILDRYPIDIIQLPVSLLDQRLIQSGHLAKLKAAGIEIHARSALLQGLMLIEPGQIPPALASAREPLTRARALAAKSKLSLLELALGFLLRRKDLDAVILGQTNAKELEVTLAAAARGKAVSDLDAGDLAGLALNDEAVLDPSRWPKGLSQA